MRTIPARVIAAPVLELPQGRTRGGSVVGSTPRAAYVDLEGWVVLITAASDPWMPNGISVTEGWETAAAGARAELSAESLDAGNLSVALQGAYRWDPAIPSCDGYAASDVAARGAALLKACGVAASGDQEGIVASLVAGGVEVAANTDTREAVGSLLCAVRERDPAGAAEASERLAGRGPGLTPEGDDLLAGVAATVASLGDAAGFSGPDRETWLAALCPPKVRSATTALAATLLELAVRGLVVEPLRQILDLGCADWRPSLRSLLGMGRGSGRAWATGCGAADLMLGRGVRARQPAGGHQAQHRDEGIAPRQAPRRDLLS